MTVVSFPKPQDRSPKAIADCDDVGLELRSNEAQASLDRLKQELLGKLKPPPKSAIDPNEI